MEARTGNVERTRLEDQLVEPTHVVHAGRGDIDDRGNGTTQIELGVKLDSRLGGAEVGPSEQGQRQVDSGESNAYTVLSNSRPSSSLAYNRLA